MPIQANISQFHDGFRIRPFIQRVAAAAYSSSSSSSGSDQSDSHDIPPDRELQPTENRVSFVASTAATNDIEANSMIARNKSSGKIADLFESGFSFTKLELYRLLEGSNFPASKVSSMFQIKRSPTDFINQNSLIQELKTALKTVLEEVDVLKVECCTVENQYRESAKLCSFDLRKSMNVLYKLQQTSAFLDDTTKVKYRLDVEKRYA